MALAAGPGGRGSVGGQERPGECESGVQARTGVYGCEADLHELALAQRDELEAEWPLVLPPLLSFLDDYSAHNKLAGTTILSLLLDNADQSLLTRTGVGKVFEKVTSRLSQLGSIARH